MMAGVLLDESAVDWWWVVGVGSRFQPLLITIIKIMAF